MGVLQKLWRNISYRVRGEEYRKEAEGLIMWYAAYGTLWRGGSDLAQRDDLFARLEGLGLRWNRQLGAWVQNSIHRRGTKQ